VANAIETLQWNIDFIRKETDAIDSSVEIKARVRNLCDHCSGIMGQYKRDKDIDMLSENLDKAFNSFDGIIKELDGNSKEGSMWMLLITHVADMMAVLPRKNDVKK